MLTTQLTNCYYTVYNIRAIDNCSRSPRRHQRLAWSRLSHPRPHSPRPSHVSVSCASSSSSSSFPVHLLRWFLLAQEALASWVPCGQTQPGYTHMVW